MRRNILGALTAAAILSTLESMTPNPSQAQMDELEEARKRRDRELRQAQKALEFGRNWGQVGPVTPGQLREANYKEIEPMIMHPVQVEARLKRLERNRKKMKS